MNRLKSIEKMKEYIKYLNERTEEYNQGHPTITDMEWDRVYFQLESLEKFIGFSLEDSPTRNISYTVKDSLNKVKHNHPMLSLPKTKDTKEVEDFVKNATYVAMAKMDGLTCSLCYEEGKLISAETRGNGIIGEDILHNAMVMSSIPKAIPYRGRLVVDGEIICPQDVFNEYFSSEYSNSRNFAAGSIRLLDSKESHSRRLMFIAWDVIEGYEDDDIDVLLFHLSNLGFQTVPYFVAGTVQERIRNVKDAAEILGYPIDGVVFKYCSRKLRASLPQTAHHLGGAIAFKFMDEEFETRLMAIDYDISRNGEMTPVAIFKPVDDGDSIIERASVHNLSVMEETLHSPAGWVGQKIWIVKRNQIIPQIERAEEDDERSKIYLLLPDVCPICGHPTEQHISDSGVKTLHCGNAQCPRRLINRLNHFCGKKGLDIKGLSEATLEKLIDWEWVNNLRDIYHLANYKTEWEKKPGFGKKSVENILKAIEESRNTSLEKFLCAIGIPFIGEVQCREIAKHVIDYPDFRDHVDMDDFNWSRLDGFAEAKSAAIENFNYAEADAVYNELHIDNLKATVDVSTLKDITVCITGKVNIFKNRTELQRAIENKGGKVTGSVSKNTKYLINNDSESNSSKNVTAKKLGVTIMTEEDFINNFLI